MPNLHAHFIVVSNPDTISANVQGEVVLMSTELGRYYGLDTIAADIWRRIQKPTKICDLCKQLEKNYEGSSDDILQDVLELLEQFKHQKLISVSP